MVTKIASEARATKRAFFKWRGELVVVVFHILGNNQGRHRIVCLSATHVLSTNVSALRNSLESG